MSSSLVTTTEFDLEVASRKTGDSRLGAFTGHPVTLGAPGNVTPQYSAYASLLHLTNGDNLTKGLALLDANKARKYSVQNHNASVTVTDPTAIKFSSAFTVTNDSGAALITIGSGTVVWDSGDANETITGTTTELTFTGNRFAIGLSITRATIGFIGNIYQVVSNVRLIGRKAAIT